MRMRSARSFRQQFVGHIAGRLDQCNVALEIGETQQRHTRLPRTQKLARTANLQILPSDLESVAILIDDLESLFRRAGEWLLEQQHAYAFHGSASDASA